MGRLIFIIVCLMLFSCSNQHHPIVIKGIIIDKETKAPITNAEVLVLLWNQVKQSSEISYTKQKRFTDNRGIFIIYYKKKPIEIDIAAVAKGYNIYSYKNRNLDNDTLIVVFELQAISKKNNATFYNNSDSLFISTRKFNKDHRVEQWGIDIESGNSAIVSNNITIWAEPSTNSRPKVLVTSDNSGIVPIFRKNIKQSIYYEFIEAPINGYKNIYQLSGNEAGFFVFSNGKYAKLILIGDNYNQSVPFLNDFYTENGIKFKLIYQSDGTTNLAISTRFDLERFLLEGL